MPTVVDAATIANDTIDMVLDDLIGKVESGKDFYSMFRNRTPLLVPRVRTSGRKSFFCKYPEYE